MARYNDCKGEWFIMWLEDCQGCINTIYRNMQCDLDYGYSPDSKAIIDYKNDILRSEEKLQDNLEKFKAMDENAIDHWCFYDLVKRGAIA